MNVLLLRMRFARATVHQVLSLNTLIEQSLCNRIAYFSNRAVTSAITLLYNYIFFDRTLQKFFFRNLFVLHLEQDWVVLVLLTWETRRHTFVVLRMVFQILIRGNHASHYSITFNCLYRITLHYGGSDITRLFYWMIKKVYNICVLCCALIGSILVQLSIPPI